MPEFVYAAIRLLGRSWQHTLVTFGWTNAGVLWAIFAEMVGLAVSFFIRNKYRELYIAWKKSRDWGEPITPRIWAMIKMDKATWIPIVLTAAFGCVAFGINIMATTYTEHKALLRHINNLTVESESLELEVQSLEKIRHIEQRFRSTRPGAPSGLKVILQANEEVNLRSLRITMDGEFESGEGVSDHFSSGYSSSTPSRNELRYTFESKQFNPEKPMIFIFSSRRPINIVDVSVQPF